MALGEAILVLLSDKPMSGHELARTLDPAAGFAWRAERQQVYRELGQLHTRGLVGNDRERPCSRKSRYDLTDAGRRHLEEWFYHPTTVRDVKDDLPVRMFAADAGNLGALRAELAERLRTHRARLGKFQALLKGAFSPPPWSPRQRGRMLGLRLVIRQEQGWVAWCEEALEFLPEPDAETAPAQPVRGATEGRDGN